MLSAALTEEPKIVFKDPAPAPPAEDLAQDDKHDKAWRTGDQFSWHGKKLAAFAIDREGDWRAHRAALGAPSLMKVFGEAFLADALRILFFCAHEPEEWLGVEAIALEKRIRSWAAQNVAPGEQSAATVLAIEIFNSAYENRAVPEEGGTDPGE